MLCVKRYDIIHGMPGFDAGSIQDCSVFLDFPVSMAMSEVPTKRFTSSLIDLLKFVLPVNIL